MRNSYKINDMKEQKRISYFDGLDGIDWTSAAQQQSKSNKAVQLHEQLSDK